ncbi:MAG: 3-oxoacyl-ACP reductase FabG [Pseudomonadota bacterium]|nr:3-oxoacyl-ACP reductase FabG [Pseudomonadota bacterium]
MFDLSGRLALVTGAHRGLGLEIARGLAQAGAIVALNGRDLQGLERSRAELAAAGHDVHAAAFDVTDRSAIHAAVAKLEAEHGGIEILVNNAGIQRRAPITAFTQDDWDAVIATNLTAPFVVTQAVLPGMIERRRGKIIHVASLLSELGRPTVIAYAAAKGGVRQLTRAMAVELAPQNIQVNAIAPGYFATEMNRALIDNAEFDAWVCKRTPAGRWGRPPEIAGLAVFLASRASDYMTGQLLMLDGGMGISL